MQWKVAFSDEFDEEFDELSEAVQDELLASAKLLATFGPQPPARRYVEGFVVREHEGTALRCR